MKKILYPVFLILLAVLFSGCASKTCNDFNVDYNIDYSNNYTKKIDNFILIQDASSSMEACENNYVNFNTSSKLIANIFASIPNNIDIKCSYLSFGHSMLISKKPNLIHMQNCPFHKTKYLNALEKVSVPGGTSRLDYSLNDAFSIIKNIHGKTAIIIISDGKNMGQLPHMAMEKIISSYPDTCVYTVHAGNSLQGKKALEQLAVTAKCSTNYELSSLLNSQAFNNFMTDIFIKKDALKDSDKDGVPDKTDICPDTPKNVPVSSNGCPYDSDDDGVPDYLDQCPKTPENVKTDSKGCPYDTDGDGVFDYKDKCPGTKKGIKVNMHGCPMMDHMMKSFEKTEKGTWIYKDIKFETGKWNINDQSAIALNKLAMFLNHHKEYKLEIQGHTDNKGNAAFNTNLSQKRADSVRDYLIKKGIDSNRLTSKGYGSSMPIANNATADGRKLNRRVEFKPLQ